mgnify:CR=1 FL=1
MLQVATTLSKNPCHQYNKYMGGVNESNQLISYYKCNITSKKWWKRVFFHMVDVTLVNAYILYTKSTEGKRLQQLEFRVMVAKGLIASTSAVVPRPIPSSSVGSPVRLIGHNKFPEPVSGSRDCIVCSNGTSGKRKRTAYQCCSYRVALFFHSCFQIYHTQKNYH